jgi:hypothetical protein
MSEPTLTIKDMRVGEFEYNLAENMKSPIFHIQKNGVWSPNFLFSCLNENLGDLVLVENDVRTSDLTADRLHAGSVQTLSHQRPRQK